MNGSGSGRGFALDADLTFLHGLQQRGLGLGWRPVDLVGQQQVGEHRPGAKLEFGCARVIHQRTGDVAGHQVRGELHALELQLQRGREGAHQQRLGDAGNAFEQHVAAAQQRDDQTADHRVLPDDRLGDLGRARPATHFARSDVRVRSASERCLCCWLSHDCATCLSMLSSSWARFTRSASVAGGGPNSVCATACGFRPQCSATACTTAGGAALWSEPQPGQHPLQRRGAQRIGGAVAGAPRPVQPAAALDGLRRAHHHRQLLGDERADASALPHAPTAPPPGTAARRSSVTLVGDQVGDRCAAFGFALAALRGVPDHPRMRAGEVHRQGGVALLQQAGVGHEVGGADDRHGSPVVGVADQRAVVAARHGRRRRPPRRCRSAPN